MTSINRAGRITMFGLSVGAGLLIASGAGTAVASAAPDDSGHGSASSSPASSSTSSTARSHRSATGTSAKPAATPAVSTGSDAAAPAVQLQTTRTTTAASPSAVSTLTAPTSAAGENTITPTASRKQATAKRAAALPTPDQVQQAITAGLDTARRRLDDLREKIQTLIQNQIIGFQDNLVVLRIDLERIFNPNKQIIYGNLANAQYWAVQGAQTANLMAAAMVISALTGQTVTAQSIVDEAMNTDSVARPGRAMYLGPGTGDWVWASDAVQLMENHGLKVTTVYYTKSQEQRALDTVESALSQGKSVIVSINGTVVTTGDADQGAWTTEHQAVLLGINITKNLVYLNDGANPQGQNLTMSIEDFLDAWQASRYTAIIVELAPVTAQATDATLAA
ncbi:C39 family peptidase [Mycolicibacterium sphagni]|nr:C39 family peptidase [Mycolicibacterium sphagni]